MQGKRAAWEQRRKHEAEEAERAAKQATLESHLQERSRVYSDHTGYSLSVAVLQRWTDEYIDQQELARLAEREAKLAESIEENYRL
jgi:hypothetical protein